MAAAFGVGSGGNTVGMATTALGWVAGEWGGGNYTNGSGSGMGNMYGDEMGSGAFVDNTGSGGSGGAGTVTSLAGTVIAGYLKDQLWQNGLKPVLTSAYNSIAGETVAAEVGSTVGVAAADALTTAWAANAAADAAGTYAASMTAAEFGVAGGTAATTATAGTGATIGSMSAAAGPAAIVAMAAMVAGMIIWGDHPGMNQRLGMSGAKPGDFAGYGGSGQFGTVSNRSSYGMDASGYGFAKDFDQISADATNNLLILGRAIEDSSDAATGATVGMNYMMQSYDPLTGMWSDTSVIFNNMLGTMQQLNPTTQAAITSTAQYLAELNGVPAAADELATAFTQATTGVYDLADATSAGSAEFAMMLEEMQRLNPATDAATTSTALYLAQMYGVPEAATALELAFYGMQGGIYGLAGAAEGAAGALASAMASIGSGGNYSDYAYGPASEGSQLTYTDPYAWGPPSGGGGSGIHFGGGEGLGNAKGGVVNRLVVPRGDDGLGFLKLGEGVIDADTMKILSTAIRSGKFGTGGNEDMVALLWSIASAVKKSAAILERFEYMGIRQDTTEVAA